MVEPCWQDLLNPKKVIPHSECFVSQRGWKFLVKIWGKACGQWISTSGWCFRTAFKDVWHGWAVLGNKDFCLFICEKDERSQTISEILGGQAFSLAVSHGTKSVCTISEYLFYIFYYLYILYILILLHSCFIFPSKNDSQRKKTCTIELAKLNFFSPKTEGRTKGLPNIPTH